MYCMDDSVIGSYLTTKFNSNIDYLEYVPEQQQQYHHNYNKSCHYSINHTDSTPHYLSDNQNLTNFIKYINANPDFKNHNQFYYQRLSNICWRRIYKNHCNLKTINPFTINWDKNSDITWLYAPKLVVQNELELSTGLESKNNIKASPFESMLTEDDDVILTDDDDEDTSVEEEEDDNMSVSSVDSNTTNFSLSSRKDSTSSSLFEMDDGKPQNPQLKSILKHSPTTATATTTTTRAKRARRVSFNYIINTREIIDNIALDYNFLDKNCI
ncbi:hypothetical protein CORT_0C05160 [Candida orthopsilosis Co 90-125]|uniref:Nitrogen regulatory protein areA GATA-like domain-containing protein n=1 Tax=Candida orthopsilosis (strain 90-125) TaxID=1136231 RepID=H8X330_CANO9|nr:hypothetical protein CORT_0C05160 [Candida orthopsilosis Co 90-125]CCG25890.1 hypothetical protein CORT_0C05160 [Candida orthopsilosis Co 90-125]